MQQPELYATKYFSDCSIMKCPADPYMGLQTLAGNQIDPFFVERWPLNVPCSYFNILTFYMTWGGSATVAHEIMLELSRTVSGYSSGLQRNYYEGDLVYVRCTDRGGARHPSSTSLHLAPSGRVAIYKSPDPNDPWRWPEWYLMDRY